MAVPGAYGFRNRRRYAGSNASAPNSAAEATELEDGEETADGEPEDVFAVLDAPADDLDGTDPDGGSANDGALLTDAIRETFGLARPPRFELTPRPYQDEAVAAWIANGGRGVVVLPTGAG